MRKNIIRRTPQQDADMAGLHPTLGRLYASRFVKSTAEVTNAITGLIPDKDLLGIETAVALLVEAVRANHRILIVGDFDADGATSSALAMRALRSFGVKEVNYLVPNRFTDGYGLTPELVVAAKAFSPDLIITVDNGIANHAGVEAAKAAGMKVVITDHHLPAATLPPADAIVNPNQRGDTFASKNLAGVGVVFYVMLALRRALVQQGWFEEKGIPQPNMSALLDLVALGTVADLVSLDQNNRILVHHGLKRIRAGQCVPGIVALLEVAERDFRNIVAGDLGFAVAARLNAAGRLEDMSLGIECLLTDDSIKARDIAYQLNKLNIERRSIEQEMQVQALETMNHIQLTSGESLPYGICLFDETWHQGVIGILAARIKDRFNRPTIIFAPGLGNQLKGSARSIAGLHLRDVLALIDATHTGLIVKFGGHAMAAGLTIEKENLTRFMEIFNEVVSAQMTEAQLQHAVLSDGELAVEEMSLEVATLLRDAGPWGQTFPEPVFDDTFRILEQRIVGDKHLKLRLSKADKLFDAIAFFVNINEWPNHRCQAIKAAYRLDINEYKGRRQLQLLVDYLEPA
ncbi:MAG TPA: single-stranded-DNA-specific exonuclease RecJ [Gammaproteobacteria bacterium]|jgi:single-stranded-DNA-specific exonuclease|nr:single-stranded-DNA-specific exonuclease RecJ [Gammaproteobacteria bacterium]